AFGPAEHLYVLKTKALQLDPELIILGLHLGNDFQDAYRTVSSFPYWASFQTDSMPPYETADAAEFSPRDIDEPVGGERVLLLRNWLRRNSMLFRIVEEGPLGQRINAWGDQQDGFGRNGCVATTTEPFSTVFNPQHSFHQLNPDTVQVGEGVGLTLLFLKEMADIAAKNDIGFLVVFIPTKESVLVGSIDENGTECEVVLRKVVETEKRLGDRVRRFLQQHNIDYVDSLEALRAAASQSRVYIRSVDTHPSEEGYRVIAEQLVSATQSKP
ncbi:MAG: hypothetical protein VCC04_00885, partial [Myxococcota bacterium]